MKERPGRGGRFNGGGDHMTSGIPLRGLKDRLGDVETDGRYRCRLDL